jgi:hypothetical protein
MPFHRLLIATYERELAACGYDGGQPYWSWAIVSFHFSFCLSMQRADGTSALTCRTPRASRWKRALCSRTTASAVGFALPLIPPRDNRLTLYVLTSTGNGLPLPAENRTDLSDSPPGNEMVEISTGGGCVQTGPFSEASGFEVTMGPGNSTEYNPHCLRRSAPLLLTPLYLHSCASLTPPAFPPFVRAQTSTLPYSKRATGPPSKPVSRERRTRPSIAV